MLDSHAVFGHGLMKQLEAENCLTEKFSNVESSKPHQYDPLLECLLILCKTLREDSSAQALVAGLPLVDGRLTPALLVRAAKRAGLSAALTKRPIDKFSNLVLPAILLLNDGSACVLKEIKGDTFSIIQPESGGGEKTASKSELESEYSGSCIFVQKNYRVDSRTRDSVLPRVSHWFWDVIWLSWPTYIEVLLASFLINLFGLATPLFIMNVYDRVVPNHAEETLWVLTIGILIVFSFELLMRGLRGYFIDFAGKRSNLILSSHIFERVLAIRMEAKPISVGAFANNFHEFESFREFLTSATLSAVIDLPFILLFLFIIWSIGGGLVWVPLAVLPLVLIAGFFIQLPLKNTLANLYRNSSQKGAHLIEMLNNLETVKVMGGEGQMQSRWEQIIGDISKLEMKSRFLSVTAVNLTGYLQQLAAVFVVVLGVYQITEGELSVGGLIACTILTGRALAPLGQVAALLTRYQQAKVSLSTLDKLMNLPVEREAEKRFLHRPSFSGRIEFKNLSFSYPDQPSKALDNVSFRMKAGERVAFIGRIGSGKSTLEKLIMGLYQPQEGAVLIDDTDIRQIDPADLRRNIGYVPQDIEMFFGSVKQNIVFGTPYAPDHEVIRVAKASGVSEFVNRSPLGFDMQVGERGASLSGGQRQSIAIARALLLSPPLYVLDEPTNAMDNSTEERLKVQFDQWIGDKTLVLVTHRASLLNLVNRLIVMDGGRIVADGPKDRVMEALKKGQIKVQQ